MFNFHRPLFPILDQTFLFNILFSNSFALFFLSERGTKFQTQDDSLICRFACGSCSLMQYKPDWLYRDYSAGRTDDSQQDQEIYLFSKASIPAVLSPSWGCGMAYAICWLGCGLEIWGSVPSEAMNFTRLRAFLLAVDQQPHLMGTASLSPGIKGLEGEATSHLSLVRSLWMSEPLPLLPLYAFVPCTGTASSSLNSRTSSRVHFERLLFFLKRVSSITQYAAPPPRTETPTPSLCLPTN